MCRTSPASRLISSLVTLVAALVLCAIGTAASAGVLSAQDSVLTPPIDTSGGGGETTEACCFYYEVAVTPDGEALPAAANSTGNSAWFTVENVGSGPSTYTLTCSSTGGVTCGTVSPSSIYLPGFLAKSATVTYSVGASGGTLTLTASGVASDAGSYTIALAGAPQVEFTNLVSENLDRGACFTSGAGEGAGVSCGDLFVVHGMPAYRTLGRDRSLSLYYNSANSTGLALTAAKVTQPAGLGVPSSVKAVLTVGSGGSVVKDSASYGGWGTASRQVVLGLGRGGVSSLATGLYPVSLAVTNVYSGASHTTTATGELIVVNRSGSEYGQGWSLLGVEQVVLDQPVSAEGRARLLWVAGDGSARVYTESGAGTNVFRGAPGEAPDSLVRYSNAGTGTWWYRRDLKHGVKVYFDETGRHRETHNRVGSKTLFRWSQLQPGEWRLISIAIPPDTLKQYTLTWGGTPRRLVSITDPGGRVLSATMIGGRLTKLEDPDTLSTWFGYTNGRLVERSVPRDASLNDSAVTKYTYGTSSTHGRLTKVDIQADSLRTQWMSSTIAPWDHQGLATSQLPTQPQTAATITDATYGLATRVDGPISGTGDATDVWVNAYGQPRRTKHVGLNTVTTVAYTNAQLPMLPTKVTYPTGRQIQQWYDSLGNLLTTYDEIPAWNGADALPPRWTTYLYEDTANAPDSPTRVRVHVGGGYRETRYVYNSLGLTDSIIAPNLHRTAASYITSGPLAGMVTAFTELAVPTWSDTAGVASDTAAAPEPQVHAFAYDASGNLKTTTAPTGVRTSYVTDGFGRITDVYDPLGMRTRHFYDAMNRDTLVQRYRDPQAHPGGLDPLALCRVTQSTCGASLPDTLPAGWAATLDTRYVHVLGRVTSIIDPRAVTLGYGTDARGLTVRETDEAGGHRRSYYSAAGLLDSTKSQSGKVVGHTYDGLGRVTRTTAPAVSYLLAGQTYTVPADTIRYHYDAVGQVDSTGSKRGGKVTRRYYGDGSLWMRVSTVNGFLDTLEYEYDAAGARSAMIHGTDTTRYYYGETSGELDSMVVSWGGSRKQLAFAWDGLGRRRRITYPGHSAGHGRMTVDYRYDAAGVLRRVVSSHPGGPAAVGDVLDVTYVVDSVSPVGYARRQTLYCDADLTYGNPCAWPSSQSATVKSTGTAYDRLGMVVRQSQFGRTDTLRYDQSGNLIYRHSSTADVGQTFTMAAGRNRVSQFTRQRSFVQSHFKPMAVVFSPEGQRLEEYPTPDDNTMSRGYYFYDGFGRTSGAARIVTVCAGVGCTLNPSFHLTACLYDAEGNMVRPCDPGAPTLALDGPNHVRVRGSGSVQEWSFVHGPGVDDPLIGVFRPVSGPRTVMYWVTDGQGRQLAVADSNGFYAQDYDNTDLATWRYAGTMTNGHTFDAERLSSGDAEKISYFRNRAYDAETGRWTQEDPIGVAGGLNLYQFNGNNPAAYSDPFGFCTPWPDCMFQGVANWGARRGGLVGWAALNGGAAANAASEAFGTNDVGAAVGSGSVVGTGVALAGALPVGRIAKVGRVLPALDRTGKVHGALPAIQDLARHSLDDLALFQQELRQSVQQRIRTAIELGPDPAHGQRQAAEQRLIRQIDKLLSGQ